MSTEIEMTDRYDTLGMERPNPDTICPGECEGTGRIPVFRGVNLQPKPGQAIPHGEDDPKLIALWDEAEAKEHSTDGYHFVVCPTCGGTGTDKERGHCAEDA